MVYGLPTLGETGWNAKLDASIEAVKATADAALPSVTAAATYAAKAYAGVTVKEFGAVGNGVADDTAAIQSALAAVGAFTRTARVLFDAGTYLVTDRLAVPDGVSVVGHDATVNFSGAGVTTPCFDMGNDTSLTGLTINLSSIVGGLATRAHVTIGNYNTGVGVSNVTLHHLTLTGGHDDANAILITGDSHNVTIDGVTVPDNAAIGRVIEAHWGNSDNHTGGTHTPGAYTTHPHNITIRNVKCGELTYGAFGSAVVLLSAAYNVTVENVHAEGCATLFHVFPSDYGFEYAETEVKAIGAAGLSFRNSVARKVRRGGCVVTGQPIISTTARTRPVVLFENVHVYGDGVATTITNIGFDITYSERVVVMGCHAAGFYAQGYKAGVQAKNTSFVDSTATANKQSGFAAIGSTGNEPKHTRFVGCTAYGNALSAADDSERAGVAIQSAHHFVVSGGFFGDDGAVETQKFGVYAWFNVKYGTVHANEIRNVAASGTGVHVDIAWDDEVAVFDNRFLGSFTRHNANARTRQDVGGRKVAYSAAAAASGTWAVGDQIWNTAPAAGGSPGWVCTTAGSPGTWKAMANLAV